MTIFDDIGRGFDNIGREIGVFATSTVPNMFSGIYHDSYDLVKSVVSIPTTLSGQGAGIVNNLVNKATETAQIVLPNVANSLSNSVNSIFSSPMLLIAGIGAAVLFGPKLLKM